MTWGEFSFPKAILHIDGDAFFASCEAALDPSLKGKPLVTGQERGIASSMSYEAKRMGVTRGMPIFEIKKKFPDVIIKPSDYETYSLFAQRMYAIVRRYTPAVEEYSIDECFADLTGLRGILRLSYPQIAAAIKKDLQSELGMTFSIGLGPTKVLAKVGSKWNKPDGLTIITSHGAREILDKLPVGKVWGIGPQTSAYLVHHGVVTAGDFVGKDEAWVADRLAKPYLELWRELRGMSVLPLALDAKETYASIQKTRTFTPATTDKAFMLSQISKNIENACIKLRRHRLSARKIFFFFKTAEFRYHGMELKLANAVCVPSEIIRAVNAYADRIIRPGARYRASGIVLMDLSESSATQHDLFGESARVESVEHIYKSIDELSARYGKHIVYLGSSARAIHGGAFQGERAKKPDRQEHLLPGETSRKRLAIPLLGEVR